ncbi:CBS domain-containing protein [Halohasta litorea]|uniref:CBS domain-containing protein n=1 Tax=Halohasta litorea TaxID=869891 RepID=A0ABD6DB62_9EURY|nr:CBS domain-containing protein [Halohasta litorea]MEA1929960.1 CBS domain-containing protein [Euryarchaeota archaeon]
MKVRDIMRSGMVTVPARADLRTATRKLLKRPGRPLTVMHDGEAVGLLTQYAVVKAGCLSNRPFEQIPVTKVMARSSGSVAPTMPVRVAVKRMNRNRVAALPVAEELEVVGSLTLRDVARNYSKLLKEAETGSSELEEAWKSDDHRIEFEN